VVVEEDVETVLLTLLDEDDTWLEVVLGA